MFPLWLAIVIIFYFLSGYWLWKQMNIFYYCDYVTITHLILLYHHWQQKNSRAPKLGYNRKTFEKKSVFKIQVHTRIILEFFEKYTCSGITLFFLELQICF